MAWRITTSGVFTEFPIPTLYSGPDEIAPGPDGALWFTENFTDKIGRITTDGTVTESPLLRARSGPLGIARGPHVTVWFTEYSSRNKIGAIRLG